MIFNIIYSGFHHIDYTKINHIYINSERKRRLRWVGHVERMDVDNWVKKCRDLDVEGSQGRGRPRKTWDEVVRGDQKAKAIIMIII